MIKYYTIHKALYPLYFSLLFYFLVRIITDTFSGESHLTEADPYTIIIEIAGCILVGYIINLVWITLSKMAFRSDKKPISRKLIFQNLAIFIAITLGIINSTIIPMVALTDDGLSYADFTLINSITLLGTIIWYFYYHTNYFMSAFAKSENDLLVLEKQKTEGELAYLKSQVHPHFLFNALNTIYFQIDEKNNAAKETIEQLSEILRYGLYESASEKVLISQEIAFLKQYISLMETRMEDRLEVVFNHETAYEAMISPQLFFPLVENAFKYVSENGKINIFISADADQITCEVTNHYAKKKKRISGGVGLTNLRRRLELLYKESFQLDFSKEGGIFIAKLTLKKQ